MASRLAILLLASIQISLAIAAAFCRCHARAMPSGLAHDRRRHRKEAQHLHHRWRSLCRRPAAASNCWSGKEFCAPGATRSLRSAGPGRRSHRLCAGGSHWAAGVHQLRLLLRHALTSGVTEAGETLSPPQYWCFTAATKKAAYASGLEEEPLIPVQALTSIVFASSGLLGLSFLLAQRWRLALIVPVIGTWGWRAVAENLRADHRGYSAISRYQVMSIVALLYLTMSAFLLPASGAVPDLWLGFHQMTSTPVIVLLQVQWILLFLYYGRSRVTASTVSFYTVSDRT